MTEIILTLAWSCMVYTVIRIMQLCMHWLLLVMGQFYLTWEEEARLPDGRMLPLWLLGVVALLFRCASSH